MDDGLDRLWNQMKEDPNISHDFKAAMGWVELNKKNDKFDKEKIVGPLMYSDVIKEANNEL